MEINFWKLGILVISIFFTSCSSKPVEVSDITWRDDIPYKKGDTKPFTGTIVWLSSEGEIEKKIGFKKGIADGTVETFYENGKLNEKYYLKNGKLDGLYIENYDNGQKMSESFYIRDKEEGIHKMWYEDGKIRSIENWKNGEKNGEYTEWHENSKIRAHGFYSNGRLKDMLNAKTFWDNGTIASEIKVIDSQTISIIEYDCNGKISSFQNYQAKNKLDDIKIDYFGTTYNYECGTTMVVHFFYGGDYVGGKGL